MQTRLLFLAILLVCSCVFGQQQKIDSLLAQIANATADSIKLQKLARLNKLYMNYDLQAGLASFRQMGRLAKKQSKTSLEIRAYDYMSEYFKNNYQQDSALFFAKRSLKLAQDHQLPSDIMLASNQLGRVYHNFSEYENAVDSYDIGIRFYEQGTVTTGITSLLSNKSNSLDKLKRYEEAIACLLRAIDIADSQNNAQAKVLTRYTAAWYYMELENYKTANRYFHQALRDSANLKLKAYVNMQHHGMGINYSRWGKYDSALFHNHKALRFFKKKGDALYVFDVQNNIAIAHGRNKQLDSAIWYAQKAVASAKAFNNKTWSYAAQQGLYSLYIENGELAKAIKGLREMHKEPKLKDILIEDDYISFYDILARGEYGVGNYKTAYTHLRFYSGLKDSLEKAKTDLKFVELETKYESEKKERENLQLQAEKAAQQQLTQQANSRNWLLGFGILLLGLVVFFIWRRYRAEARAKRTIAGQKEEIEHQKLLVENLQRELHHRMKNNLSFIDLFIQLAKARFKDAAYIDKLNELQNRIGSMFAIHKQLFVQEDITKVSAKSYIDALLQNVQRAYGNPQIHIAHLTTADEIMRADTSLPVGIIVNEFVTNSFKYAFDASQEGNIQLRLHSDTANYYLELKDDGKGLPVNFDIDNLDSFGLETIKLLTQEYHGSFALDGSDGVQLDIVLPKQAA
ncbi:MAG: sensor histidine kinase [Flavobacteriaceae bacterium]|nr:sensor histidine kinase [Flavobacteriaceae bacterium]